MGKRFLGVALLRVSTAALWAQDMQTDPTEAYKLASSWITESSAKHRAWAAQSIMHFRFESLYPELLARLSEFQPSDSGKFTGSEDELAMESIADAIIRSDLKPAAADARKLYPQFPALAMILLARAPDDRQAALWSIFERAQVPEVWLAAANLLANEPPPGFVSKLLDDLDVRENSGIRRKWQRWRFVRRLHQNDKTSRALSGRLAQDTSLFAGSGGASEYDYSGGKKFG
jgi:hypothetical protein